MCGFITWINELIIEIIMEFEKKEFDIEINNILEINVKKLNVKILYDLKTMQYLNFNEFNVQVMVNEYKVNENVMMVMLGKIDQ